MKLKKKSLKKSVQTVTDDIKDHAKKAPQKRASIDSRLILSTGSTLLDLAISGGRVRGGGVPGGLMMELYGPSSSGKTAVMTEIAASAQSKGGRVTILDPEARLDAEYARLYGMKLGKDDYHRPQTVTDVFDQIRKWDPENEKVINVMGVDSIAALSTELEMSEGGDKRGQRKAKELSEGCRKTALDMADPHKLIIFTNQERQSEYGKTTPGGFAVGYHASLRCRVERKKRIEPEKTINGKKVKKTIGIYSEVLIKKSSVDDEYRVAPLHIIFGLGIDDVRGNLQWYKDMSGDTKYDAVDKTFARLDAAIAHIEDNNLEADLREMVIDLWEEIEEKFKTNRKKKVRF